jgi:hypothetical protein
MRKTTTGLLAPKNRKFLVVGIAAAVIGTYFLAGDKIKSLFKKDETPQPPNEPKPVIAPTTVQTPTTVTVVKDVIAPATDGPGFDPDKRLFKGVKGNEVERIQIIANYLANLFNVKSYDAIVYGKNYGTVNFPIKVDGDFGNNTERAVIAVRGKAYIDAGYTTLDKMRYEYAYWSGYYGKEFPDSLRSSSRYQRYADAFKTGQIDKQKSN